MLHLLFTTSFFCLQPAGNACQQSTYRNQGKKSIHTHTYEFIYIGISHQVEKNVHREFTEATGTTEIYLLLCLACVLSFDLAHVIPDMDMDMNKDRQAMSSINFCHVKMWFTFKGSIIYFTNIKITCYDIFYGILLASLHGLFSSLPSLQFSLFASFFSYSEL